MQVRTSAVLQWAGKNGDTPILRDLAELYGAAFPYAEERSHIGYYYVQDSPGARPVRIVSVSQPAGTRAWIGRDDEGDVIPERILDSSQFLYGVARLARALATEDEVVPGFDEDAWSLIRGHALRWILPGEGGVGAFQRTGWGCGWGTFGHADHVENLIEGIYCTAAFEGVSGSPAEFCNSIVDTDVFSILVAGEMLLANAFDANRFDLSSPQRELLRRYVERGLKLFAFRSSMTSVELLDGSEATGI